MSSDVNYFKLGSFVIGGVVLLVVGVIIFGAGKLFEERVTVETATTESVQGLDAGAAVKYKGVTVGSVSQIELARWRYHTGDIERDLEIGQYVLLELSLQRKMIMARDQADFRRNLSKAVETGFRTRIASSGLTGPSYIELIFLDPEQYPPPALGWTPEQPFIPSAPSTISQLVSAAEALGATLRKIRLVEAVDHADELILNLNKAVSDIQVPLLRDKIVVLLDQTGDASRRLKDILNSPNIDKSLDNFAQTTASVKDLAGGEDVKTFVSDLPAISARVRHSAERLDELLSQPELKLAIANVGDTAATMAPAAADLRRVLHELNGLISTQQDNIQSILLNLRKFLEDATALSEDAKNNPSRVLFGAPPPRINPGEPR
jgi:ABC-type transporter Mla subunit MlaD